MAGGAPALVAALTLLIAVLPTAAQVVPAPPDALPRDLEGISVEEKLDAAVPQDVTFVDEQGRTVRLADYFTEGKPVLLNLGYYRCPMLCQRMWQDLARVIREQKFTPGTDFELVTISFDPEEGPELARAKKRSMIEAVGRPEAAEGWHFLTGTEEAGRTVADAVGFQYRWLEYQQQYAHPAVLIILTPDGRVSRYLTGLAPAPNDLRLALLEASNGQIGGPIDWFLHRCYIYDPEANAYVANAWFIMRTAAALTVLILGSAIGGMLLYERRKRRAAHSEPATA